MTRSARGVPSATLEVAGHESPDVRRSEDRWGQLGVWEVDLHTGSHYWSTQVFEILGASEAGFDQLLELVHPDDQALVAHVLERSRAQPGPYKLEHRILRNGEVRTINQHVQSVPDPSGRPARLLGAVSDVTAAQSLEHQLHRVLRMQSLGLLAGGLAHDFHNALSIVLGHIDLVSRHPLVAAEADISESLGAMRRATKRATLLTRRLLSLGRDEEPQQDRIVVTEVFAAVAKLAAPALGSGAEIVVDHDGKEEHPVQVTADLHHLEQVLLDLLFNARDAGATRMRLKVELVSVDPGGELHDRLALDPGPYGVISVIDNGEGMDHDTRFRVFDPFFTTKDTELGSGLGLTNANRFARRSGGAMTVSSEPGHGTTMMLLLPAAAAVGSAAIPADERCLQRPTRVVVAAADPLAEHLATELREHRHQVALGESSAVIARLISTEPIDLVVIEEVLVDVLTERLLDPDRTLVLGAPGPGRLDRAPYVADPTDVAAVVRKVDELLSPPP